MRPSSVTIALILITSSFSAVGNAGQRPALQCQIGPLHKVYGGSEWLVYGCTDGKSLVVVSAPGSPAMPFYFFFSRDSEGYHLRGEGTGDKHTTDAAYRDLAALGVGDVQALIVEAVQQAQAH